MPSGNALPQNVNIAAKVTTNVQGGQQVTYRTSYSNVACLLVDNGGGLSVIYDARQIMITHTMYFTQLVATTPGDIVVFGNRKFFIRSGVLDPSGQNRLFRLDLQETSGTEIVIES